MPPREVKAGPEDLPQRGFELFDLSVTLGPGLVPWVSASSRLGHVHGIPRFDPEIPPIADLVDSVYDFVDAVRFAERDTLPDLKRALEQLAFGEPTVMELFQATRGVAAENGFELLLRVLPSPHFAVLPWELLLDPGKRHSDGSPSFLALAPDATVVRLARGRTYPIRTNRLEPPLNLLVVLSSPSGRDAADDSLSFDIFEEKRALLAELEPLVNVGLLRVDVEDHPTLQNLRRRIGAQRRGYHLFHYLGHAEPDKLILEDDFGRREDQSATRFTEILRLCPELRLAVYAGCETARASGDPLSVDARSSSGWRNIISLADLCVQESCPIVVGMQAVLSFRTERLFTRFFYQGIASGYSVTDAMRLARGAIRGDRHIGNLLDWSVPVLFLGGTEPGPLLDRFTPGVPPDRPARHVLRLGLRQRETRFFARDAALRQAIDLLSGETRERILVLSGPPAVGKTMLIDRALEEIDGPVSILYVRMEDLAPELSWLSTGDKSRWWVKDLAEMNAEAPFERLCRLVAELLTRGDGHRRIAEPGQKPLEWWERLIEDIALRRFVLVIDSADILFEREEALTSSVAEYWLALQIEKLRDQSAERPLDDLLRALIKHVRSSSGFTQMPGTYNPLIGGLHELGDWLSGWTQIARDVVASDAENWLRYFETRVKGLSSGREPEEREREQKDLRAAARQLAAIRQDLDKALHTVADRRSGVRLLVASDKLPREFLHLPSDQRFEMRLGRLTWFETWRWIRRNLPGLLRYGDQYLERLWPRLGTELELWEELEQRSLEGGTDALGLTKIVDEISPRRPSTTRLYSRLQRGERPLRVAAAGPFIASAEALAAAVTRLAAEHCVGGRVVAGEVDHSASLAVLVEVPSPFAATGAANESDVIDFLKNVAEHDPDIVLLDYGRRVTLPLQNENAHERPVLRRLFHQTLLIAAGGNEGESKQENEASAPGVYPEVFAVGSIDSSGLLQSYAEWIPRLRKPDVFMLDELVGTALEGALTKESLNLLQDSQGPHTRGSSFAALHAVGAAILAWSIHPELTPDELRDLLRRASRPVKIRSNDDHRREYP